MGEHHRRGTGASPIPTTMSRWKWQRRSSEASASSRCSWAVHRMPRADQLPPRLQGLEHSNAIAIDDARFRQDFDNLVDAIKGRPRGFARRELDRLQRGVRVLKTSSLLAQASPSSCCSRHGRRSSMPSCSTPASRATACGSESSLPARQPSRRSCSSRSTKPARSDSGASTAERQNGDTIMRG